MRHLFKWAVTAVLVASICIYADLDAWNNGTSSTIRVGTIVLSGDSRSSWPVGGLANPTASIGLSAVNGTSTNALRSDGAPALDQSIDPTMTGTWIFAPSTGDNGVVITNSATTQIGLTINGFSGQTNDLLRWAAGGTNYGKILKGGQLQLVPGGSGDPLGIAWTTDTTTGFSKNGSQTISMVMAGNTKYTFAAATLTTPNGVLDFNESSGILQLGSDAASPTDQVLKTADGSGTDKSGAKWTGEGGQSTGTGRGGPVVIRTSVTHVTSSSTANIYEERAHYVPKFITLTDNTLSNLFTVTLPATNQIGMTFTCTVECSNGTDFQSLTTPVTIDAVAKSTTITTVVAPSAAQTGVAASSGTLSVTYSVSDAGSNVLNVSITADTSLTSLLFLRARVVMTGINSVGAGVVINEI